jgi:hypothetical protein
MTCKGKGARKFAPVTVLYAIAWRAIRAWALEQALSRPALQSTDPPITDVSVTTLEGLYATPSPYRWDSSAR